MNSNPPKKINHADGEEQQKASSLGEIFKRERIKRGLSLRTAGEMIGISHSYLASLENGADPRSGLPLVPSREVISKICTAYGLDMIDIVSLMDIGREEDFYVDMAWRIYELKTKNPVKYKKLLNIIMGNSEK